MNLRPNLISFKSNEHREMEMARLRELQRQREIQRERERQIERERRREMERQRQEEALVTRLQSYPALDDQVSTKVAGFLSQFTCAIQNASEHNIMEFFGDEGTAEALRANLSPMCKEDSINLRKEVQKLEEVQDPVMALICANRMQKFAPKEGLLSEEQQVQFVDGVKSVISTIVRNSDLSKFEPEDKSAILEMVQKIENSDSVKFGIELQLKKLVDKLNSKNLNLNFIPPVQVKNLDASTKILKKALK